MSLTQMNNFLAEETRKLVKRGGTFLPSHTSDAMSLLSSLAPGSPLLRLAYDSTIDVSNSNAISAMAAIRPPLISALHNAVPTVIPRHPVEAAYDDGSFASRRHHNNSSMNIDLNVDDIGDDDDEDDGLESSGSILSDEQITSRLDAAQRQFESHVEAQMSTPGVRKSLLAQSTFTPFASVMASGGNGNVVSSSSSSSSSLSNVASSSSLSRFLSSHGVNFLDGITNRRQSLGIRVPEPRSEYDRMLTMMRSAPEMELTQRIFVGLNDLMGECERRLLNLEDQCSLQCDAKTGVHQLFVQCITTGRSETVRKDLSLLKQLAQIEAKIHLNERHIGHYFEEQLYHTLQITLATAKAHLAQLQDSQSATINTKMALAKNASKLANLMNVQMPTISSTLVIADRLKEAKISLERKNDAVDLVKGLQGWQLTQDTLNTKVFDYRNAIEVKIEMQNVKDAKDAKEIISVQLSSVMAAKTVEEDEERKLVEKMLGSIAVEDYIGSRSLFAVVNDVTVRVGRILDFASEIRLLCREWYVESVESVSNVGVAIRVRFSNAETGVRFVAKLVIGASYPFVEEIPFEIDSRFCNINVDQIRDMVEEEVDKNGYKLMTRLCRRLEGMTSQDK
jgi:hypothetical protein